MMEPTKYYRRPNSSFRCGLSSAGRPCTHGPLKGSCGQSQAGEERCYPVRTLTGWSRLVAFGMMLFAFLAIVIVLPNWRNNELIVPGPLSNPHAQLLHATAVSGEAIDKNDRCAACHPSTSLKSDSKHESQSVLVSTRVGEQSKLCMKCHAETMPTGFMGSPHDLVDEDLHRLLDSVASSNPRKLAMEVTECSQCHREHRGSGENLQFITSQRCQSCHRQQFESFSHGHPEFRDYPLDRPRSIAFDHGRHQSLHFAKKDATFDCRQCHVNQQESSVVGSVFRSVSFDQACASCHQASLRSAASEGVVVLQLPSLDRQKLASQGVELGPWPETASQLMDGKLSPLLADLLRSTPEGNSVLSALPPSGRLSDIDLTQKSQAQNVAVLAGSLRQVIYQLANEGQPLVRRSVESQLTEHFKYKQNAAPKYVSRSNGLGTEHGLATASLSAPMDSLTSQWLNQFVSGIPPDLLRSAWLRWFGTDGPASAMASTIRQPRVRSSSARWQLDDDLLSPVASSPSQPSGSQNTKSKDAPKASEDLLEEGFLGDSNLLKSESGLNATIAGQSSVELSKLRSWEHAQYGGWMIDESRVALVYIPSGHADPWITRWLEWQVLQSEDRQKTEMEGSLVRQCVQCHSFAPSRVRELLDGSEFSLSTRLVAWQSRGNHSVPDLNACWKIQQRPNGERNLTRFSHTPHLTIPTLRDCQSCHSLRTTDPTSSSHGWSEGGRTTHHEFQSMQRSDCASCHTKQSAGDSCTQCHNYHVHSMSK